MLRHDPWLMGPAAASYGFGAQAGSACLPQDLSATSSSSGPHCRHLQKLTGTSSPGWEPGGSAIVGLSGPCGVAPQ